MKTCLFISDCLNYIVFDLRRPSSRWHRLDVNMVTTVPRLLRKMRIVVGLEGEEVPRTQETEGHEEETTTKQATQHIFGQKKKKPLNSAQPPAS